MDRMHQLSDASEDEDDKVRKDASFSCFTAVFHCWMKRVEQMYELGHVCFYYVLVSPIESKNVCFKFAVSYCVSWWLT